MRNVVTATRPVTANRLKLVPSTQPDPLALPDTPCLEASEAAAAIGLDPRQTQLYLWRRKTGQIECRQDSVEPDSRTGMGARYWRDLLEPLVASVYIKRTSNPVRRINLTASHPIHSWMQAKVDWEVMCCRDVDFMRYLHVGEPEAAAWRHGPPMHERINALHLLAVTGKQAVDLAVLVCSQELQIHRVARDEALIERMVQLQCAFWKSVKAGKAPGTERFHDLHAIEAAFTAVAGSDHGPS